MKFPRIENIVAPSSKQLSSDLQHLKEWMSKQPHLPKIEDDDWLMTFLYHNKYSLEKTKSKLDYYYCVRNKYPHLLGDRDPLSPEIVANRRTCQGFFAKDLTKDGSRLCFLRFDPDPTVFDMNWMIKRMTMGLDMIMLEKDRTKSFIMIADGKNFHYRTLIKMLTDAPAITDIFFNAYTERLELAHVINPPPFAKFAVDKVKVFLPEKYQDRIFIHDKDEKTTKNDLLKTIDKHVLPTDYGGRGPSVNECEEWTIKKIEEYRHWFLEQDNIKTNEALRMRRDKNQFEEMKGSFRKLEVD